MKKTIVYISLVLLLSISAVIVFAVSGSKELETVIVPEGAAEVTYTHDKTVLPNFVYNTSIIEESEIYSTELPPWEESSRSDADCILLGTVIEVFYTFADGEAWTLSTVRVDEVNRGRLEEGDLITVYTPGGYASCEDYSTIHKDSDYRLSGKDYIEFKLGSLPHPRPGDNAVFYLEKIPAASPLPVGAYMRLNVPTESIKDKAAKAET